jgi:hypothetical protein
VSIDFVSFYGFSSPFWNIQCFVFFLHLIIRLWSCSIPTYRFGV